MCAANATHHSGLIDGVHVEAAVLCRRYELRLGLPVVRLFSPKHLPKHFTFGIRNTTPVAKKRLVMVILKRTVEEEGSGGFVTGLLVGYGGHNTPLTVCRIY